MDFSERNKKVAIARWHNFLLLEKEKIPNNDEALVSKALLCGFLAGDGSVHARKEKKFNHYEINFFPDDDLMLTKYCDVLKQLYGKTPRVKRKSKVFDVRLTSRTIYDDLASYSTFGIYSWNLPKRLFAVEGAREAWLRAFFSAEAYVGPDHIKIQSVNKKGLAEVSKLLDELDIEHRYYEYSPKNKKHSRVGMIFINKKSARKIYYDRIGFWHLRKTVALREALGL